MTSRQRTALLTVIGIADLACFALGSLDYGETWSMVGALGLMAWLVLIELTRTE